ncbi:unnamed protein product [Musa hybrid cultivar]
MIETSVSQEKTMNCNSITSNDKKQGEACLTRIRDLEMPKFYQKLNIKYKRMNTLSTLGQKITYRR